MASSATAALPTNGGAPAISSASANGVSMPATAKSQFKANGSHNRALDGGRKQPASNLDGPQRRNSSQKAWTPGSNPITQKSSNTPPLNGVSNQPRGTSKNLASSRETNTPDRHAHDRLMYLLANFVGYPATITVKNGDGFDGIFSGSSFETAEGSYILKMAKQTVFGADRQVNGTDKNGSGYIGTGPEFMMQFEIKDVVNLAVETVTFNDLPSKPQNGITSPAGFRTDSDISGHLPTRERPLQPWAPPVGSDMDLSLESSGTLNPNVSGPNRAWDQFEANERLYGVKSDYDENIYTTTIDRSDPLYKQKEAAAERIAREIEKENSLNSHVAEERGYALADDSGLNEEDKYSGVNRGPLDGLPSQSGNQNKYTPPARRAAGMSPTVSGAPQGSATPSQTARPDQTAAKTSDGKVQNVPLQQGGTQSTTLAGASDTAPNTAAAPDEPPTASKKPVHVDKARLDTAQKQSTTSSSPFTKVPGESATATVENDVRDAFKQFASTEKMRLQERRRNQAKHDKDIKLNDLMKFSKNFKLTTPVPRDLVPILAKDKRKQEEILERAQKMAKEAYQGSTGQGQKPTGNLVDSKTQRPLAAATTAASQATHTTIRGRNAHNLQGGSHQQQTRQSQPQNLPLQPARHAPALSQRLTNLQQSRAHGTHPGVPSPLPLHDGRVPPLGPGDMGAHVRHSGAPTPTSATSTHFNIKAAEFIPNATTQIFTPTGEPSLASSPRSGANGKLESRVPTPSDFFGSRKPLPVSERPSITEFFNPIKRLRKEVEESKEDWSSNGGIRPAHKTGPRWDVAEENKEKTYIEMFERVTFSTQSYSPQPPYPTPHAPYQHQLPAHLQHNGPVVPQSPAPHQAPHHLPSQPHHHHMGVPPHFDDHRVHISSPPSLLNSPRLQSVSMAYQSPMGQHAHLVYGPPQYGMGYAGPQVQFRQFSGAPQFVSQHNGHIAPMMAHSPSGGPLVGLPQGMGSPYSHQMYTPNPVHAYPHHAGPPAPQPGSNSFPSPGRAAPMMIHQGSQQGQPAHQMMMFGMSPGQQSQHLYVPQQPGQGPVPRAGYMPPQQPHFGVVPHGPHMPAHHRGGPNVGHPPHPPPPGHVVAQQTHLNGGAHAVGVDGEEDTKS